MEKQATARRKASGRVVPEAKAVAKKAQPAKQYVVPSKRTGHGKGVRVAVKTGRREKAFEGILETWLGGYEPVDIYRATSLERVDMIRKGVPATFLEHMVSRMDITKERLYLTLRLPRATVDRKIKNNDTLSAEHSERVIGLERLIGEVEDMVERSGNPEGFDADRWVADWLERPLPALGGARPAEFMDTMEGQEVVSKLLAQMQSGAYA